MAWFLNIVGSHTGWPWCEESIAIADNVAGMILRGNAARLLGMQYLFVTRKAFTLDY